MASHTLQATIERPWREVCDFLGEARNYPRWASWIGAGLQEQRGDWIAQGSDGRAHKVRFTERNAFGVADHCLVASEAEARFVALRALPHGSGCEVLLTFFELPDAAGLAGAAQRDLARLKALVEGSVEDCAAGSVGASMAGSVETPAGAVPRHLNDR